MRAAIWILALLALFGAAWLVQERWREAAARELGRGEPAPLQEGWSRAVIGRPSGADPIETAADPGRGAEAVNPPPVASGGSPGGANTASPTLASPAPAVHPSTSPAVAAEPRRHVVQAGETLSSVCATYYGSKSRTLVDALARFNGLADASALGVGQTLLVPARDVLER